MNLEVCPTAQANVAPNTREDYNSTHTFCHLILLIEMDYVKLSPKLQRIESK